MATVSTIILKNSTEEGAVPSSLKIGEVALGLYADEEKIWIKNSKGKIVDIRVPNVSSLWEGGSLVSFDTTLDYEEAKANGEFDEQSVVFIKETQSIYLGDVCYSESSIDGGEIDLN